MISHSWMTLMMWLVLHLTSLALMAPWVQGEVFSSTARLQTLYESPDQVEEFLEEYIRREEARLETIRTVMREIKLKSNQSAGEGIEFAEHPLGAFHLIKKYAKITHHINSCADNGIGLHAAMERSSLRLPDTEDYLGSASALLRLQRIYRLSKRELLEGSVAGRFIEPLTFQDVHAIAKKAHELNFFTQAIEWYDVALREEDPDIDVTIEQRRLSVLGLIDIYLQHNDLDNANNFAKWGKTMYPHDEDISEAYTHVMQSVDAFYNGNTTLPPPAVPAFIDENYAALCRGEVDWNNEYLSQGYCRVSTDSVPYRLLKQEILSFDPFVSIFYDVLTESEGEFFRQEAKQKLNRALIGEPGESVVSDIRVGQLTWMDDSSPTIHKISKRIMGLTGLDVTIRPTFSSSEAFQIVNYGIGGHYAPHMDVYDISLSSTVTWLNKTVLKDVPENLLGTGDRLATFLFYLGEVVEGGATVFPRIGIRVPVVKNGAAFWYNLHRTGENDNRLLHAGCPVLLGQKWVANKWIRERGQEFRHSCGLTPETPHYKY